MGVAVEALVRFTEPRDPDALLAALGAIVEARPEFAGWTAGEGSRTGRLTGAVHAWRELWPTPEAGLLPVRVAVRLPGAGPSDEREDGAASVLVPTAWPFRRAEGERSEAVLSAVAENEALLCGLVTDVVRGLGPASVRLHTDAGPPLPFDAHAVRYSGPQALLADLDWCVELWEKGSPRRRLAPLRTRTATGVWPLHDWRPAADRQRLLTSLAALAAARPFIGEAEAAAVLDVAGDALVRGAPDLLGGFVDGLLTAPAELAGVRDRAAGPLGDAAVEAGG